MKTAKVPAQITTIEDKIAGNLGLSQMLLILMPIFSGSGLFLLLPPRSEFSPLKTTLIFVMAVVCGTLAIRLKDRILLFWVLVMLRYNLRPRYYVFNKNDAYLRDINPEVVPNEETTKSEEKVESHLSPATMSIAETVKLEGIVSNPQARLHFKTDRKGALRAYITEIE